MRRIIAVFCIGLPLFFGAMTVQAATVAGLYEVTVPAAGEDTKSRNQALGDALRRVMVKVTGRDPAPGVEQLVSQAARYVQQFRYHREQSPSGEPQTSLWVRFDKTGLDRVLRDRGLPLWGNSRPGILVWLARDIAGRRDLLGNNSREAAAALATATDRGLPVQLPLMDLEDRGRLTAADLWSDYAPAVRQASARYAQPLVLTGRLRQVAADLWVSRWTLYEAERSQAIEVKAEDAAGAVRLAIARVTESLAGQYAPAGGHDGQQSVRLKITGVDGLQDYVRALKLVGEREVVEQVAVRSVAGDSLVLMVKVRGGREALAQVLDLVHGLQREPDPVAEPDTLPVFETLPSHASQPVGTSEQAALATGGPQHAAGPVPPTVASPMMPPASSSLPHLTYRLHP